MTNRTREIFDFAQLEPLAIDDMKSMLRDCDREELDYVDQVIYNLRDSLDSVDQQDDAEETVWSPL